MLNKVSKSRLDLHSHWGSLPNECKGMSVIEFSSPAMWSGVIGHVPFSLSLRASARMRCAKTNDLQVARQHAHPTVGKLSLNKATRFSRRSPQTDFITSHKKSRPAISRSELVIFLARYRFLVSWDHSQWNTVGTQASFSPKTMPPTPCDKASQTPI